MVIIGLTGTLGSGKGTVARYLVERHGFEHFSARDLISEEVKYRKLPIDRETLTFVANALRREHSPIFIVESLYSRAVKAGKNAVIESIRTPAEVTFLRASPDFYLFAVDADVRKRYERIRTRRSETDSVSFERFVADEDREKFSTNEYEQNLTECIRLADMKLNNNSTPRSLERKVEKALRKIPT